MLITDVRNHMSSLIDLHQDRRGATWVRRFVCSHDRNIDDGRPRQFFRRFTGLSEAEAQARLTAEGYNELPRPDRRTPLRIVFEVLREPMLALLIAGGLVYLALGDWREALILLIFANLSIVITVVQETRT